MSPLSHFFFSAVRSILRRYHLNTPRASLLRMLPGVPDGYGVFAVKGGIRIASCSTGNADVISKSLFWLGDFDPWVNTVAASLVSSGDTVLDVGANIGAVALYLARRVGPNGRVICFEPFPPNAARLNQNILANGFDNITQEAIALSSAAGMANMIQADEPGHAHLVDEQSADCCSVRTVTLDEYLHVNRLNAISLCKIDVEGHEAAVFEGASQAIRTTRINAFLFERHRVIDPRQDAVISLLLQNHYRVWRIHKRPLNVVLVEIGRTGAGSPTSDYVAVSAKSAAADIVSQLN